MPIESSFVDTPFGKFHIESAGQGKPVLLIHGGTASAREWRPVLEAPEEFAAAAGPFLDETANA